VEANRRPKVSKYLIALFWVTSVLVAFSAYFVRSSEHPSNGLGLHGPLQLSFLKGEQSNKLHLYPREWLMSHSPEVHDSGIQNDRIVRMTNTGRSIVTMNGFNATAPWYAIEVKKNGTWAVIPFVWATTGAPQPPSLKPGESLDFPVIVPQGTESWRVRLVYDELAATNSVTRLSDSVLTILRLPPRVKQKPFVVWSEEVPR
jgi:hypothetical protein